MLEKIEQERSEIYVYESAVAQPHRGNGIGVTLYTGLGKREDGAPLRY